MRQFAGRALRAWFVLISGLGLLLVVGAGVAPAWGKPPAQGQGHGSGRAPIVAGPAVVAPTRGSHVGRPGSEGTPAGSPFGVGIGGVPGPIGNSGTVLCNPVPPASDSSCNLTYHNGSVMLTTTTHLVFWSPSGYSFPAGYEALIARYLTDVAHDSGYHTFTDSVNTQYYENPGPQNIQNSSTHGTDYTDTTAYPAVASGCTNQGTATTCLTESQEFDELDSFINSKDNSARGLNQLWFLVLPPDVQTCYDDFSWCGPYGGGSTGGYCAYHNSFTGGFGGSTPTIWANMPYDPGAGSGCPNQQPNGNSADVTIDVLSHEMNESITDPNGGGWWDDNTTNGGENGDQCNFVYGAAIGSTVNGQYDELVNGNPYRVQQEWSNASTGCAMNLGAVAPTASFTYSPGSPKALDSVSFDGSGSSSNNTGGSIVSYSWDFGDGHTGSGATPTHAYAQSGTYTVTLTVEDSTTLTASTNKSVVVVTRATSLTYTGDTTGTYNDSVTLSATLTDTGSSSGVNNEQLVFTLGIETCPATTDSSGHASCTVTPADTPGDPLTAAVSFGGDTVYAPSSTSSSFTLNKEDSQVTYTGPATVHYHDPVTLTATLTDPDDNTGIAGGRTVTFTLSGGDSCSGTTDSSGNVSCTVTPQSTGNQTVTASFAGDNYYLSSSSTPASFAITPEETTMSYTGPIVILAGSGGATLTATLLEDGSNDNDSDPGSSAPSPAQTVTISLGSQHCSATTDGSGNVSCTIPSVSVPLGPETIVASSTANAYYQAATATANAIVFAFPSRGAFTLGDQTVATATLSTTVTWWADSWWSLNLLTGGTAPSSDKGFAGNVTLPTTTPTTPSKCTPNWTTTGGNSPPPTSGVPSYMGTLVASSVTKNGNTIAGNTVHIVVVKTNPGYSPTPGTYGTGTIVATYC